MLSHLSKIPLIRKRFRVLTSPAQLAFILLSLFLVILFTGEGINLFYRHWKLQRAAQQTVRWAIMYLPLQGYHLNNTPCQPHETCYQESAESYLSRRVAFIHAKARAEVLGQTGEELADGFAFTYYPPDAPLSVEVWGFPDFEEQARLNHPGLPGLPVQVQLNQKVTGITPLLKVIAPHLTMTAVADAINEGILVGFGNMTPPTFSEQGRQTNSAPDYSNVGNGQLIIQEAKLELSVNNTDVTVENAARIAGEARGYVINQRTWYAGEHRLATITIAVPAESFEAVLRQLRSIAVQTLQEEVSGRDVTKDHYDLEGRLHNQELTRDRIRNLMEEATNVEEALLVSRELSTIEAQIENLQSELAFLQNRITLSIITINISPVASAADINVPWYPGEVALSAIKTLLVILRGLVNVLIWGLIVLAPLFLLLYFLIHVIWRIKRRSRPQN